MEVKYDNKRNEALLAEMRRLLKKECHPETRMLIEMAIEAQEGRVVDLSRLRTLRRGALV